MFIVQWCHVTLAILKDSLQVNLVIHYINIGT